MMTLRGVLAALALALVLAGALNAGPQPDELLDDPALEERARDLSAGLRCVVCRNESIDESGADLARDMRMVVRERLVEGDSDEAVLAYMVDRYGEFVLLRPTTQGVNILLWVAAPVMFIVALGAALLYLRRRERASSAETGAQLSAEEEARLRELMRE